MTSAAQRKLRPKPWEAAGFQNLLRACLSHDGADEGPVATFEESGCTHSRYGLRLTLPTGVQVYLQIVAGQPPDERRPAQGAPPLRQRSAPLPTTGSTALAAVELHLIDALTARQDPLVQAVTPLSSSNGSIPYGLRVAFHSGAYVFCYVALLVPAGWTRPLGGLFPELSHV
ncbi:hypothetical protein MHW47_00125 [Streptomyces sp. OfavH-34-F]|uniref:hypothetical protein n=1 Tax=Streptomyces sp. OfavH-34-F TaxID=2917760 RepID=UPI001EF3D348|nr:hypothetical protein [Streptomyces sp. OfavH-34-F]MCG7522861.1 hypothetical protein [Streptomyces sp. OfavH-34-F]